MFILKNQLLSCFLALSPLETVLIHFYTFLALDTVTLSRYVLEVIKQYIHTLIYSDFRPESCLVLCTYMINSLWPGFKPTQQCKELNWHCMDILFLIHDKSEKKRWNQSIGFLPLKEIMKMVAVAIPVIAPKLREDLHSVVRLKGVSIHISITSIVEYWYCV